MRREEHRPALGEGGEAAWTMGRGAHPSRAWSRWEVTTEPGHHHCHRAGWLMGICARSSASLTRRVSHGRLSAAHLLPSRCASSLPMSRCSLALLKL